MKEFLEFWFQQCPADQFCEIRPLNKRPGQKPLRQSWCKRPEEALSACEQSDAHGDDVYLGALPRSQPSGAAKSVTCFNALWGDIDVGSVGHAVDSRFPNRESAIEHLRASGVPWPSAIVDTGGGIHCWWWLTEPMDADRWPMIIRNLAHAAGADMNTLDAPRILRVPGTRNCKTRPERLVQVVEFAKTLHAPSAFSGIPAAPASIGKVLGHDAPTRPQGDERPFDRANDVPILDVAHWLGIAMHDEGEKVYCACPVHGGHNVNQMVVGGARNVATCFGDCAGRPYTNVDLTMAVRRVDPREAVNLLAKEFRFEGFGARRGPAARGGAAPSAVTPGGGWRDELITKRGKVEPSLSNTITIFREAPEFSGKFRFNEMTQSIDYELVSMGDGDVAKLREALERIYHVEPSRETTWDALLAVSDDQRYHPVREWLETLEWDGKERIINVLGEILGAPENELHREMLKRWFISCVARAMEPGSKVDTTLVLHGRQSAMKSTFFATLGKPWFVDSALDVGSKDAYMQLSKAWLYEFAEFETLFRGKQAGQVKAFLTSQGDTFRPPYGRVVVELKRSSIIVGTTNEDRFLSDSTGSRRFWVVGVGRKIDIAKLERWKRQLWAEAVALYRQNEPWWLTQEQDDEREVDADKYDLSDPWEESVREFVSKTTGKLTTKSLLSMCLNIDLARQSHSDMQRLGRIMTRLGYRVVVGKENGASVRKWIKRDATHRLYDV